MARWTWRAWLVCAALTVLVIAGSAAVWFSHNWPFTKDAVARDLQSHLSGTLQIGDFRETWFPPGAVAHDLRVSYPNAGLRTAPQITAHDLVIRGSWHGLLTHSLSRIQVIGLHVYVPPGQRVGSLFVSGAKGKVRSVGELELNDASYDTQALKFQTRLLVLAHLGYGETVRFHGFLVTDQPHGELKGEGRAGPVNTLSLSAIPIAGTFQYANADLSAFGGLAGTLSSKGRFDGSLARVNVTGDLSVPRFHVDGSAHSSALTATYNASVDTHNADTGLKNVEAHVGRTTILAAGTVDGTHGQKGKTATLRLVVNQGRVEDLLNYFSEQRQPSMTGAVRLRADAVLPPGPPSFLRRVRLTGDFGVAGSKFTSPAKQTSINDLSASAWKKETHQKESREEDDARTAVSNLAGHVVVRDGAATLRNISFEFPGAVAEMGGTFQLIPKTVDIHGTLRTTGTISEAAAGFKALMLKVATPFMKKKDITVVPFAITGSSSNPKIGLDLAHKSRY